MMKQKIGLPLIVIWIACLALSASAAPKQAAKQPPQESLRWVSLSTDSRDTVREIIRSEVDSRESFSTRQEEKTNLKAVEDEKEREDTEYKNAIITANKEFVRAKKRRDDITSQFQMSSTDLDESAKGIKTIRSTIENLEGQMSRYEQDIKAQQDSLKRWLQTEKQGEILVAVIYTRGFRDSSHSLEGKADMASAPLIAAHMGTYIQSFSKVINNVTTIDFIRATEEGTAKWNNEEPIRIALETTDKGTSYLRLKRYELYPFQENKAGKVKPGGSTGYKAALILSRTELDGFLKANQYTTDKYELDRAYKIISSTNQSNKHAEEGLNEQVKSFQDRILNLQNKIREARSERDAQKIQLKRREESYYKLSLDVASIREKKDLAERTFQQSQSILQDKKRVHESIIIKSALAATKGSQTPAEASAEVILDKLVEVKNDAKTQHSSSATEVTNFRVTSESATQSITEARITAIRLISFINEGDSVRVKMAFRVRTILEEQPPAEEAGKQGAEPPVKTSAEPPAPMQADTQASPAQEPKTPPPAAVTKPSIAVAKAIPPFKRAYRPLAVKDALGCSFELRSANITQEGIRVLVEVVNLDVESRKVAFYDDKFGSWPRSSIHDEAGKQYLTSLAYVWQGSKKALMWDIDSRGRGVEIQPQTSVTMELIFKNIPAKVKTVKINLHPFIYYQNGRRETWQEFDLNMPDMHLRR
jgi:hypothetical protein